jgi:UDP-GlcNAc:undecaprenyl-phosphate GlcNAc-1-phosphate transferase
MIFFSTLLFSVLITIALIPALAGLAVRLRFVDVPDERKVHEQPVPRIGGIAMALGALAPMLYWQYGDQFVRAWLAGATVLFVFGVLDDMWGLAPVYKFAGQITAAALVIILGGVKIKTLGMLLPDGLVLPDGVAFPLTLVAIVGVTNAINLADGLDGLAGGICLLVFSSIGYLAYLQGDSSIGFLALALGGAIFGFLKFNTYPASVFMGDTGSQLLGFSAITLSLGLTQRATALSPMLPLLLLGLPVLDTLFVFTIRIANGRSPFSADTNHFHHRLMRMGLHHAESVLVIYVLQTILILSAYIFRFYSDLMLLSGYLFFSIAILYVLTKADRIGQRTKRTGWYDRVLKSNLRRLRDEGIIIRHTFRAFETGLPLLLLFTCLVPSQVPRGFTYASPAVAAAIFAVWRLKPKRLGSFLRLTLYLLIPFAVYLSEMRPVAWMAGLPTTVYNMLFALFTFFIIVISKFSRRMKGFKSTPMDFLILFLALVFPGLAGHNSQDYHTGVMAAKIIILYFCYEVMLAELRGEVKRVAMATIAALIVLAVKGLGFWG